MPDQLRRRGMPGGPVVLLLHGGSERSRLRVPDSRLAPALGPVLDLRERVAAMGVEVWVLRHAVFGWNDGAPVAEAREALEVVRAARPGVPIVLAGHSMGARTAVHVAGDPAVAGVIGLAPWLPADDPVDPLRGKRLAVAYAAADWVCPLSSMTGFLDRARRVAQVSTTSMGPDVHEMLRRRLWARFLYDQAVALTGG